MKNILILWMLFVLPISAHAATLGREGNGGDPTALEFQQKAAEAIFEFQAIPLLRAKIGHTDLKTALDGVTVLIVDEPLPATKDGTKQLSAAMNFPLEKKILIHRESWKKIKDQNLKRALALHEILGIVGLESTGSYDLSRLYLDFVSQINHKFASSSGSPEDILARSTAFASLGNPSQTKLETLKNWFDQGEEVDFSEIEGSMNIGRCFGDSKPNKPVAGYFTTMVKTVDEAGPGFPESRVRKLFLGSNYLVHPATYDRFPRSNGHDYYWDWKYVDWMSKNSWNQYSELAEEPNLTALAKRKGKKEWEFKYQLVKYGEYYVSAGFTLLDIVSDSGRKIPAGTLYSMCYYFRQVRR